MKRPGKILRISFVVLVVLLATAITLTIGWRPFLGPKKRALTPRTFERTPERLARGKYLVRGLIDCESCHSPKDWTQHGGPVPDGKELTGQAVTDAPDFPGKMNIPNITPDMETGIGKWTDDQIARAIREGIRDDDTTLFPMMPYQSFKTLSDEDLAAVVVYLRSVPPVKNPLPPMQINFPVNYLVRSAPEPITQPVPGPNASDPIARGKYMVTLGCGCHDAIEKIPYGGGERLKGPWGDVVSANLTSDPSGISYYTEGTFISAMRTGYVGARKLNSIMPFIQIRNLTDDDLKAIFAYLKSLPPVKHRVDNTLAATYCKVCKQKHGGGDQN